MGEKEFLLSSSSFYRSFILRWVLQNGRMMVDCVNFASLVVYGQKKERSMDRIRDRGDSKGEKRGNKRGKIESFFAKESLIYMSIPHL